MQQTVFYLNELGNRKNIEDAIFPLPGKAGPNSSLFLVCDGVGGESKGEVASKIACEAISEYFQAMPNDFPSAEYVQSAADFAMQKMQEYAEADPTAERMSTTLSGVFLGKDLSVQAFWCGDSRVHHIRDGKVLWRSEDHSLVNELVKRGELSWEDAQQHPQKNAIIRSLNARNKNCSVQSNLLMDVRPGDYFLLCTDGLLEQVDDTDIHLFLTDQEEQNKSKLFLQHCQGRTNDNFSMYLIEMGSPAAAAVPAPKQSTSGQSSKSSYVLWALGLLLAAALAWWFLGPYLNKSAKQASPQPNKEKGVKAPPAKDPPAKEPPAKESPAKESPAKESPEKESPAKESPAKESPAKESPAKESPGKESPAKESPGKESPGK